MKTLLKNISLYLSILFAGYTVAQGQQIKATVEAKETGFQRIAIPQEFRSKIGNNIGFVRLFNQKGEEIPFVVKPEAVATTDFKPSSFERVVNADDSTETFLLHNPEKLKKQRYSLKIANSTATKSYRIEGSDDQQAWFSLVPQGYISDLYSNTETFSIKAISFPLMDYRFVRITLDNKKSAPINILDIGEMETQHTDVTYEKLRNVSWKEELETQNKSSLLSLATEGLSPVDLIKIHVSSPNQYLRESEIYQHTNTGRKKADVQQIIEYISLSGNSKNEFAVAIDKGSEFYIRIFHGDNPPLKIDSITLYQKPIQLLAELQRGFTYTLDADSNRRAPNYDLARINLALPDQLPAAEITRIEIPLSQTDEKNGTYGKIILVLGSILGVLIVFYFGSSLLKDMKKEENKR